MEGDKARIAARVSIESAEGEIRKIDRELDTLLDLILKGGAADRINTKMVALEQRKKDIATMLKTAEEPPALLHPNIAKIYHEQIAALHDQIHNEATRAKAADRLRSLVSRIELVPSGEERVIVFRGDLAAILTFAAGKKKPDFLKEKELLDTFLGWTAAGQNAKKPF